MSGHRSARRPRMCVWEITLACNAHCSHCGSGAGKPRDGELTTQEALRMLESLAALGCENVTLSGGEPLLRRDWPVLARAVRSHGMQVDLISNGLLVPEQIDSIRTAGFTSVSLSVDGPEPHHDLLRGSGSFRMVMHAARALRRAGVATGAVTQVGRANVSVLEQIHSLLCQEGFEGWQVQRTLPQGRADTSICLAPSDTAALEGAISRLAATSPMHVVAADTVGWMGPREPSLRRGRGPGRLWASCQAGISVIGIVSDGTVRGCLTLPPEFDEGNLRSRSLESLWNDADTFAYNRAKTPQDMTGGCGRCALGSLCRAGCTCAAWTATGSTTDNPTCTRWPGLPGA